MWVLLISSSFATASLTPSSVSQLWLAVPNTEILSRNPEVYIDISENTADPSTSKKVSCDEEIW